MRDGGIRDSERFAVLIQDNAGIAREVAATYARDPDDRADLMQDILANLWASSPRYDDARPFPTWMYRVALSYGPTPAGAVRRGIADGSFVIKGEANKCADAMITSGDAERPSLRLVLGSTALTSITNALADRLAKIEAQRAVALAADLS